MGRPEFGHNQPLQQFQTLAGLHGSVEQRPVKKHRGPAPAAGSGGGMWPVLSTTDSRAAITSTEGALAMRSHSRAWRR